MPPKKTTTASTKAPAKKTTTTGVKKAGASKPAASKPAASKPAAAEAAKPAEKKEPEKPPKHITIGAKQIAKVLIEDDENVIKSEKKGVLVIDNEGKIATRFLPYSGANLLEAMNPSQTDIERLRLAIMGSVRFGKPLAIDLGECGPDMFDALRQRFDQVQPGLLEKCMNREVCTREVYETIYKESDEEQYKVESYYDLENEVAAKFIFMIVMKSAVYDKEFTKQFYTVTISE